MVRPIPRHYSEILYDHFHERALQNPSYSLRAFARDLNMTSGTLSKILSQKIGLSLQKADEVARRLNLSQADKDFFLILVEANSARKSEERERAESKLLNYNTNYINLEDEYFAIISEWYHFALVELVRVKDFQFDNSWIAKRLGITSEEVEKGIERLIKIGLLEIKDGKLLQTYDYFTSPGGTPSEAVRKFHKQVLAKAILAVDSQSIEERNITTGFLRVRQNELQAIGTKIQEFRRELAKEIESGEQHDSVYGFAIQFFRADAGE